MSLKDDHVKHSYVSYSEVSFNDESSSLSVIPQFHNLSVVLLGVLKKGT